MTHWAYYNEIDSYAAQWLRNLVAAGHIAPGYVDERSIADVRPYDLQGFTQCHFFAGIGVWSHALRRAGWRDERRVWTGSCPCQPFSDAGQGRGLADERHLWPFWYHLIDQCRPPVVFGEQVASKDAMPWLDLVQDDLEGMGYSVGAVPFPAASVGAPHIRDRLYFVAHDYGQRLDAVPIAALHDIEHHAQPRGGARELADGGGARLEVGRLQLARQELTTTERGGDAGGLGHADGEHAGRHTGAGGGAQGIGELRGGADLLGASGATRGLGQSDNCAQRSQRGIPDGSDAEGGRGAATRGFWADADWIPCRDGKARPVEPGTFPLVDGATSRVGRLRAYGNAIVAPQAVEWISVVMECLP